MRIEGSVAVVTGGASGIGEALAHRIAREGAASVSVLDVDEDGARATASAISGHAYTVDVADEVSTREAFADIETREGRIDIVCLNAGIATAGSVDAPNEAWERTWQVNVMSHVYATRCVLPGMLQRGTGHLVHVASAAGLLTNIGAAPYSVTKHAVVALAEWLAVTYGDRGIGVSAVCPQFVDTPMLDAFSGDSAQMREWVDGAAISAGAVAEATVAGIEAGEFLILPHPEVGEFLSRKVADPDRWIEGMQRLRSSLE